MRKICLYSLSFVILILIVAFGEKLNSGIFDWEKIKVKNNSAGEVRNFFSSPTRSLKRLDIKSITLFPGRSAKEYRVEKGVDEMIIIKQGVAEINVNDRQVTLGDGSVIIISAGDRISVRNNTDINIIYYSLLFKPFLSDGQASSAANGAPVFIDWDKLDFSPSAKGGRRDIIRKPTSVLQELEIHVTTLNEGVTSHSAHIHPDEEIILVREGFVEETINEIKYPLGPGSVIFLTNDDPHSIKNSGSGRCEYYAIRWLTGLPVAKQP